MISIIIVQYHVKKELFDSIQSIIDSKPKVKYEIIVVDNDEIKTIKKDLLKKFPKVTYVPNENKGFGQGNNTGAKYAKGEYLFFLNPDTVVFKGAVDVLYHFLETNKKAGVVAPFLLHEDKKPFEQGTRILTPIRAIFSISFINKLFPNNPIAKNYLINWDTITTKEVDVVPGTAFMISSKLYHSLNGFDEHFFLYFEEFDLCKRIKEKGYKLFIEPKAKIIHLWERSTKQRNDISKVFKQSHFYYFRKHYGLATALLTHAILTFSKYSLICLLILLIEGFLLFYKIGIYMPFIGDQAWFYISARDMLLTGHIPLVGITSSHTWLHQGPLWTYLLAIALWLGHFNPVSGAYLTAIIALVTVLLIYKFGSEMFSPRVGVLASLIYATAPLIVFSGRMPYHTSIIATVTLLWFYAVYKWINGFKYGFPLVIFLSALLYNLELSTVMLVPVLVIVFIYGIIKKTQWAKQLLDKKILLLSFMGFLIPMIPVLIYDFHHGFPQTVKFAGWIFYSALTIFGFPKIHPLAQGESIQNMIPFASDLIRKLLFYNSSIASWIFIVVCFINLLILNYYAFKRKYYVQSYSLLLLLFFIPVLLYIAEKTNSAAYWPIFYPSVVFMVALLFDRLMSTWKLFYPTVLLILFFTVYNCITLVETDFLTFNSYTLASLLGQAKQIVYETKGVEYNLVGRGDGSQYESFTMNYAYLTWWLGHGQSYIKQPVQILINATPKGIIIEKRGTK